MGTLSLFPPFPTFPAAGAAAACSLSKMLSVASDNRLTAEGSSHLMGTLSLLVLSINFALFSVLLSRFGGVTSECLHKASSAGFEFANTDQIDLTSDREV